MELGFPVPNLGMRVCPLWKMLLHSFLQIFKTAHKPEFLVEHKVSLVVAVLI